MTLPAELESAARSSAAPELVRVNFERLLESDASSAERLGSDGRLAGVVAAVMAGSRSLSSLVLTDRAALEVIASCLPKRPEATVTASMSRPSIADPRLAGDAADLVRRKRLGLLAIAAQDLAGFTALEEVGEALSDLADGVLQAACALAGVGVGLAVIAMGKHGARELNYASDVDVMFVGEDDTGCARRVLAIAGRAFRVDTDLRPEGRSGALVRSLESFQSYWERWARPWEFQALLKARASAGDPELGAEFAAAASSAIWGHRLDADDLAELRSMKGRAEEIVSRKGLSEREIKRGRGGIRDIEFSVQLLQLVHGAADPLIRQPSTLEALGELAEAGYVDGGDAAALALSYRFFRTVEHRLQLVEETQVHTVPGDPQARDTLAKVLGFAGTGGPDVTGKARNASGSRERMDAVIGRHQASARAIHERLFFRPLLEVFAAETPLIDGARWSVAAAESRLEALGFRQADRTRQALRELTRGLTRSSRLMQQLLPVLLGWLSDTPDPDQGLLSLRTLVSVGHRRDVLVASWRESPELARRLCLLLGTGRQVGQLVGRHPEIATRLDDDRELEHPARAELLERAVLAVDQGPVRGGPALRRFVESMTLRTLAADLLLPSSTASTSRALAALGDATLAAALQAAAPRVPFGIVAMGRLGGEELAYGSDLDVLLVYDGSGAGDAALADEATTSVFRLLNGTTPAERIITVDASLRPEGRHGPLARSLDAYAEYHRRRIETWERQALLRARPVAGDPEVLGRFMALVSEALWSAPFGDEEARAIRRMKARVERERIPAGEDPQFHLKLGKGSLSDVEWAVQLLQLQHGVAETNTVEAIRLLVGAGHLEAGEGAVLSEAYRFLSATRNRWHLVGNFVAGAGGIVSKAGSDSLPADREVLSRLARSLGTSPTELREAYRRVTRRARRVVEERFYGL
ncbi:MAG: bifunctional [glutamine synthetase] adenylyltransferase/[glutamine synthetase]-adenylyl-L-tyrosine phosphorylase [Acidimicrobiales bacterium]|jgi:[glutamine synthetase] adenylyltransferase / [glutamine synthetase]-adenylyl-L-tyrosine phosphorylase